MQTREGFEREEGERQTGPSVDEVQRRRRRGYRVVIAAWLSWSAQGYLLYKAVVEEQSQLWWAWGAVILIITAFFIVENNQERRRRRAAADRE